MISGVYNLGGLQCNRHVTQGYAMGAMHIHDVYEIYMTLTGGVRMLVNREVYALRRGDVMLFTSADLHQVSVPQDVTYDRYVITFPHSVISALPGEGARLLSCFDREGHGHCVALSDAELVEFMSLADGMGDIAGEGELDSVERWLTLCRLLLLLCRAARRSPDRMHERKRGDDPYVRVVMEHVDANFAQRISLDELSALCFIDKSYMCRLFRRETGFSIGDYISYRRLSHGMELLRDGASVSSAALMTGFSSDTSFITAFRRNVGITPYQYALRCRANAAK